MKKLVLSFISTTCIFNCFSDEKINSDQKIQEIRQKMEDQLKEIPTRNTLVLLRALNNCARRKTDCDLLKSRSAEGREHWEKHISEEMPKSLIDEVASAKRIYSPKDKATKEEKDFAIELVQINFEKLAKQDTEIFNAVKQFDDLAQQLCALVEETQKENTK